MRARAACSLALLWVSWALGGCSLGFDTGAVPFEAQPVEQDQGSPDSGPDLSMDLEAPDLAEDLSEDLAQDTPEDLPPVDMGPDLVEVDMGPPPVPGLGVRCGIDDEARCNPDASAWPGCLDITCQNKLSPEAFCQRNAGSLHGYCTYPCQDNSDCKGNPEDSFKGSMRCVPDGDGRAFCRPGSQQSCLGDGGCPLGELCKRTTDATGTIERRRCQAATSLGAPAGAFCNEDPRLGGVSNYVQQCANDNCERDICLALCDPAAQDVDCGHPDLVCRDQGVVTGDPSLRGQGLCQARGCRSAQDCQAEESYCVDLYADASRDASTFGQCRQDNPLSSGNLGLGSTCGDLEAADPLACASRLCVGFEPNYYCSSYCESHSDCGPEMLCVVGYDNPPFPLFTACTPARGSGELCSDGGGCANPDEVCAPFLFGQVTEDGQRVQDAYAEGRCVRPSANGVRQGRSCEAYACEVPGACVGSPATCTHVCGRDADCDDGTECLLVPLLGSDENTSGEAVTLGFCN